MTPQDGTWSASSDETEPHGALQVQLVLYVRGFNRHLVDIWLEVHHPKTQHKN